MDAIFTFACWILGEPSSRIFHVGIASTKNFFDLKKAIINSRPSLDVDPGTLELYRPPEEVSTLSNEELAFWNPNPAQLRKFNDRRRLSDIFQSAFDPEALHILIQPPLNCKFFIVVCLSH